MVATAKGTLLLFCEGRKRSRRDGGDIDTSLKRSEDGGRTWPSQMLIHQEGGDAPIRVGNLCAIVERGGKCVHLLFTRGGGECLYYTKNTDDGKTWSPIVTDSDVPGEKEYKETNFLKDFGGSPVRIGAGPVHGMQLESGRLIAPSCVGRTVDAKRVGNCTTIYSDDGGKTWVSRGPVPNTRFPRRKRSRRSKSTGTQTANAKRRNRGDFLCVAAAPGKRCPTLRPSGPS